MFGLIPQASYSPVAIRDIVLAQHRELERLLRECSQAAAAEAENSFDRAENLVRLAQELYGRFENHLRFEERFLFPVLRNADVWGDERVANLTHEHAEQRRDLELFIDLVDSACPLGELRQALATLSTILLADIAAEEDTYLDIALCEETASHGERLAG